MLFGGGIRERAVIDLERIDLKQRPEQSRRRMRRQGHNGDKTCLVLIKQRHGIFQSGRAVNILAPVDQIPAFLF